MPLLRTTGRVIGMLAGGFGAALWVAIIWFPVGGFMLEGITVVVGASMALFALIAAIASFHGHAGVVFACFVLSFFGVGTFALNVRDHWFQIFGLLDLLLLVASVLLWWSGRTASTDG